MQPDLADCAVALPAPRDPRAALPWALAVAVSLAAFSFLGAGPFGARFIVGWYIHMFPLRLSALALLLVAAGGIAMGLRALGLAPRAVAFAQAVIDHRRAAAWAIAAGILLPLVIVWVLRAFPNSGDEYAYLFEARTFLAGRLGNPLPPLPELFQQYQVHFAHGRWAALYNPGWPILLSGGLALGLPAWLVSPLCGGLLLFAAMRLAIRRDGPAAGPLAVGLVAFSPFFLFNAASYFVHIPAAAAGLMFCWAASRFLDKPTVAAAVLCGMAMGALGLVRTVDVPIFALPFVAAFAWRGRWPHYCRAPAIIIGGLPFLVALVLFYLETTGSPLPSAGRAASFDLSPIDEHGHHFSFLHQMATVLVRLVSLAEWTSPLLVLGAGLAYFRLARERRLRFTDFVFPSFVVAYLVIPFDGANQYGPRYYFEGFPFLVLTLVSALLPMLQEAARSRRREFAALLLVAHGALCVLVLGFVSGWMRTLVDQRMDLYDQVRAQHLHNAVVVVHSSTSNIFPMEPRDLVRNGIALDGEVLYVLDIATRLPELRQLYPGREFFIYHRDPSRPTGMLRPLPLSGSEASG